MMLIYFAYVNKLKRQIYGKTYDVYDLSEFESDIPVWIFPRLGYIPKNRIGK